jgi:hypothetical protein
VLVVLVFWCVWASVEVSFDACCAEILPRRLAKLSEIKRENANFKSLNTTKQSNNFVSNKDIKSSNSMSSRRDQCEENCQFRILENALSVAMLMSEVLFWFWLTRREIFK